MRLQGYIGGTSMPFDASFAMVAGLVSDATANGGTVWGVAEVGITSGSAFWRVNPRFGAADADISDVFYIHGAETSDSECFQRVCELDGQLIELVGLHTLGATGIIRFEI